MVDQSDDLSGLLCDSIPPSLALACFNYARHRRLLLAIQLEHHFNKPAEALWLILGQPERVDWVPGIESCQFDGKIRAFTLPGAGALKEKILQLDHELRRIEYSCIESTTPFEAHLASMQVIETQTGCQLIWKTQVQPEKFEPFIRQSMEGALRRLETLLA